MNEQRDREVARHSPDGRWRWDGRQWLPAAVGPPAPTGGRLALVVLGIGIASLAATYAGLVTFAIAGGSMGSLDSLLSVILVGLVLGPVLGALALGVTARQHMAALAGGVCGAVGLVASALFWIIFLLV